MAGIEALRPTLAEKYPPDAYSRLPHLNSPDATYIPIQDFNQRLVPLIAQSELSVSEDKQKLEAITRAYQRIVGESPIRDVRKPQDAFRLLAMHILTEAVSDRTKVKEGMLVINPVEDSYRGFGLEYSFETNDVEIIIPAGYSAKPADGQKKGPLSRYYRIGLDVNTDEMSYASGFLKTVSSDVRVVSEYSGKWGTHKHFVIDEEVDEGLKQQIIQRMTKLSGEDAVEDKRRAIVSQYLKTRLEGKVMLLKQQARDTFEEIFRIRSGLCRVKLLPDFQTGDSTGYIAAVSLEGLSLEPEELIIQANQVKVSGDRPPLAVLKDLSRNDGVYWIPELIEKADMDQVSKMLRARGRRGLIVRHAGQYSTYGWKKTDVRGATAYLRETISLLESQNKLKSNWQKPQFAPSINMQLTFSRVG
jgi:hypothetical protein